MTGSARAVAVGCGLMLAIGAVARLPARQGSTTSAPQTPTFQTRTDAVLLDVSVLDRDGRPVKGLTASDFTVLEDGVARPVTSFAAVELPEWAGGAAWMREVGPDVASNRRDAQRAIVILLDDCTIAGNTMALARSVATAAVDQLSPADLAAVVYVNFRNRGQEFTVDRLRLREAVDRLRPIQASTAPGRFSAEKPNSAGASGRSVPSGMCMGDPVGQALINAARIFGSWPDARKAILLISHGIRATVRDQQMLDGEFPTDVFNALHRANVNVYQFDPNGLETDPTRPLTDFGLFADNTGGRSFANTNTPAALVPRVFRENSAYYLIGFEPRDLGRNGRFHRVQVKVNRPDLQVRARSGYFAESEKIVSPAVKASSAVDRALSGGLPGGALPIALTAVPVASSQKPGAALVFAARVDPDAGVPPGTPLELRVVVFNDQWKEVASARQPFVLPATTGAAQVAEVGAQVRVPPGRYEVRAAISSASGDRTGSAFISVTVPNFTRAPVSLAGLILERESGGAAMADDVSALVRARPTTRRAFAPNERVQLVVRTYQSRSTKTPGAVRLAIRLTDARDQTFYTLDKALDPSMFSADRSADVRTPLPLDRLVPGEYLISVEAVTGSTSDRRTLRFTVRP